MIYFRLFLSFMQIGLFGFGGGYAAMPLLQAQIVERHGWLTLSEFTDLITISQMTPGPATLAGTNWLLAGLFALCLVLLRATKLSPIAVMVLAGVLNLIISLLR